MNWQRKIEIALLCVAVSAATSSASVTYYADSLRGSDESDGLSARTAWRSLARVNSAPLKPGDRMLLRRGSVWRGQLDSKSGMPGAPVYYGAYGKGPKPLLLGSDSRSRAEDWIDDGGGLWRTLEGFEGLDVGNIVFNQGERHGVKRWAKDELAGDLDYWHDPSSDRVFIKSQANPARRFQSIELGKSRTVVPHGNRHDIVWDALSIMHSGSFAFSGGNAKRLVVRNCDMGWIGGALQRWKTQKDGSRHPVRYGNAVEYWSPSWSNIVERCRIWEVYDAALTTQQAKSRNPIHDIVFRDNVIWNCEYSFEYWNHDPRSYTSDIVFEHNTCVDAGGGWGHGQRPNKNGAHVLSYSNPAPCTNIVVRNNIFCRTTDYCTRMWDDWRYGAKFANNLLWIPSNCVYRCEGYGRPYAVRRTNQADRVFGAGPDEFARYQRTMQMDVSSLYGKPRFVNEGKRDYRLRHDSPGRRLATDGGAVGARNMPGIAEDQSSVSSAARACFRHWAVSLDPDTLGFTIECDAAPENRCIVDDGWIALPKGWEVSGKPRVDVKVDSACLRLPVSLSGRKEDLKLTIAESGLKIAMPTGGVVSGTLSWGLARPGNVLAVRADVPAEGSSVTSGPCVPDGADALFDVQSDRLLLLGGAVLEYRPEPGRFAFRAVDSLSLSCRRDFLSRRFDVRWRKPVEGGMFNTPPVGWMTWYAVKFDASERVILENARAFMEKFAGYTDEKPVLWVDWEWGHGRFNNTGDEEEDVTRPRASAYPRGMAPLADDLSKIGFTPALWVSLVNDCRTNALWSANPDWVLGEMDRWCGPVWGDPTAPGFCEEYVPKLFSLYRSWGYKAFKWDTLPASISAFAKFRDRMYDPSAMPEDVYRKMVAAGRKAVGETTYMMSCSGENDGCTLAAADVFDAMRVGGDIFAWDSFVEEGVNRILRYQPLHGTLILSDADNLVLRPEFSTLAQARTRVSIYGLSGVPVTIGDTIAALDEPRVDMLRRIMPVVPVKPASLARATPHVNGLMLSEAGFARPWGTWKVKAWSNFDTNTAGRVVLSAPGCAVWDYWLDKPLSLDGRDVELDVGPCDTRVVRVTPIAVGAATLLSVSRHITQGGYEVESFRSDSTSASGSVKCSGREPVTVTLLLPEGHGKIASSHPYDVAGRMLRLRLASARAQTVEWSVSF